MTRQEAEDFIRSQARVCRGVRRTEVTERDYNQMNASLQDAVVALTATPPVQGVAAAVAPVIDPVAGVTARTTNELLALLFDENLRQEAADLDEQMRQGCGADFNNIVLANPLDGEARSYICPSCGVTGTYRAPLIQVEEVAA